MNLHVPNRIKLQHLAHPGSLAHPTTMNLPDGAGGMQSHTFGGLTKLEHAAIQIAATTLMSRGMSEFETVEEAAVTIAQAVLAECDRIQKPPPDPGDTNGEPDQLGQGTSEPKVLIE